MRSTTKPPLPQAKPKDDAAERKKTDAPSPDDRPPTPQPEAEEKSFIAAADDDPEAKVRVSGCDG